ncbi:unnamed protein product [Plutella xylostella]|uniref:Lipase n=1 Tax=Plutella xylostella TaxID=51655 RepID=A0A8S4CYK0_PLUXY|nr:unnamed protein product [Plutella xylostella]
MLVRNVVCFLLVALAVGSATPNIFSLVKEVNDLADFESRVSNNIDEDADLDVPELITKYKYPLEIHEVTTEDGYILQLHRIPHGRDRHTAPRPDRPLALVVHGLTLSSSVFIDTGPGNGLGYILAESGFDVWLANTRGNMYSRRHRRLNPDSLLSNDYWDFSWEEVGTFDLPATIDYILKNTKRSRLHYIGYSQGTTAFFVMGAMKPEYNDKIISSHHLAPTVIMEHTDNLLLKALAPLTGSVSTITSLLGIGEFIPNTEILRMAGQAACNDDAFTQPLCSNIFFLIGGWNSDQLNTTTLPIIVSHTPAGASVKQVLHYGQEIGKPNFRRYDHGIIKNLLKYGSRIPPNYDLRKVTSRVYLYYGANDPLVSVTDVFALNDQLPNVGGMFRVPMDEFTHIDFAFGINAPTLVYEPMISRILKEDAV